MRKALLRGCVTLISLSLAMPPGWAQTAPPAPTGAGAPAAAPDEQNATQFNPEQLDALLAPIALYPDQLLMQVLMASTYPVQIVEASRWLESSSNKDLKGDDLAKALEIKSWDPSVKSLVPFPQVLDMMDQQLDWTQQVGYAVAQQQADVMDSIQRLRRQAQQAGSLKSNEQQVVSTAAVVDDQGTPLPQQPIVIQTADPEVVYVPTYNPNVVYGTWPYPSYPPTYYPPPPGYALGSAFVGGMAFAAGVAVVGSLWGWCGANWGGSCCGGGGGSINVNRNVYNNITRNNINGGNFNGNTWRASARAGTGLSQRPPGGPVGRPGRANGLPANAVGRSSVSVPGSAVNRPNIGGGAGQNRPGGDQGRAAAANRPDVAGGAGQNRAGLGQGGAAAANRPSATGGAGQSRVAGSQGAGANRASAGGGAGARPAQRPTQQMQRPAQRPSGAFGGINDGARAGQFQQRGAQSRSMQRAGGARGGGGGGAQFQRGGGRR